MLVGSDQALPLFLLGGLHFMLDLFRRCLLVVVFVLTIGLLFIGGNKEKFEEFVAGKSIKEIKTALNH